MLYGQAVFSQFDTKPQRHTSQAARSLANVLLEFDATTGTLWTWMRPLGRPCFQIELLEDLVRYQEVLRANRGLYASPDTVGGEQPVRWSVVGSLNPSAFSLGGDLEFFLEAIRARDRTGLMAYAALCIKNIWLHYTRVDAGYVTISLVAGRCFGGGFEAALSSDFIVAERGAKFGFPERLWNFFPGMGAHSFLTRRVGTRTAEKIILSGDRYTADEMLEMGIVDIVCDNDNGREEVCRFIAKHTKRYNALKGNMQARRRVWNLQHAELQDIASDWVDNVLSDEANVEESIEQVVAVRRVHA
jgi:DSF synthase